MRRVNKRRQREGAVCVGSLLLVCPQVQIMFDAQRVAERVNTFETIFYLIRCSFTC